MRQLYFVTPFAATGDQITVPVPAQPSGSVSFTTGWTINYAEDPATFPAALDIDRATTNWMFFVITQMLQQYQQFGAPEWIDAADNGGVAFAYDYGARVRYSSNFPTVPFSTYRSVLAGTATNSDTPGATANWQLEPFVIASNALADAGTDNSTVMTPAQVAREIARFSASSYAIDSGTLNNPAAVLTPAPTALTGNLTVTVRMGFTNTLPVTLTVNGLAPTSAVGGAGAVFAGGELPAGSLATFKYNDVADVFQLQNIVTGGPLQIANALTAKHAVPLGQADARYAALAGSASQVFSLGDGTAETMGSSVRQVQQAKTISCVASGTADAIVGAFAPVLTAAPAAGTTFFVRAGFANATTTPTFTPGAGITPVVITKGNNLPLAIGDIPGAGAWAILTLDTVNNTYVLQNPANGVIASANIGQVQGSFKNLVVSTTGASGVVTFSADEYTLENAAHQYFTARAIALAPSMGGTVGVANSLDTGSWAFSTWYARFLIYNPTTATLALLWSLSATAPTLPAGYTYFARTGWDRTQSATNFWPLAIQQYGRRVQYKIGATGNVSASPVMATGPLGTIGAGPVSWSTVATGAFVPPTAASIAITVQVGSAAAAGNIAQAAPNSNYAGWSSAVPAPLMVLVSSSDTAYGSFILESTNIFFAAQVAGLALVCNGWGDNL